MTIGERVQADIVTAMKARDEHTLTTLRMVKSALRNKEIEKREKQKANDDRQLNDSVFLANAPAHIVQGKRKLTAENLLLLEKAKAALAA